jgi:hypothetical protein
MPKFAIFSADATELFRQKSGSPHLECYTYIDPDDSGASFFVVKTTNKLIHVDFSEISYTPGNFSSLIEGLYQCIYE